MVCLRQLENHEYVEDRKLHSELKIEKCFFLQIFQLFKKWKEVLPNLKNLEVKKLFLIHTHKNKMKKARRYLQKCNLKYIVNEMIVYTEWKKENVYADPGRVF